MKTNGEERNASTASNQLKLPGEMTHDLNHSNFVKQHDLLESSIQNANFIENPTAIAGPSNIDSTPAIFKLTIDCFDDLFDYLSLKDLSSIGQTCKAMQRVAGEYFKRNYFAFEDYNHSGCGIYGDEICMIDKSERDRSSKAIKVPVTVFSAYITQLSQFHTAIGRILIHVMKHIDEFSSLKQINIFCCNLNISSYEFIARLLQTLERIKLYRCIEFDGDFYDKFLKHCSNLKRFNVTQCDLVRSRVNDDGTIVHEYPWLKRKYPKLEHLKLVPRIRLRIDELDEFFMLNPSLQGFSTSAHCLWINRHQLLSSTAKLHSLEIWITKTFDPPSDEFGNLTTRMQAICQLINQLHDQGFYKMLKLFIHDNAQRTIDEVASLNGLEMLSIAHFEEEFNQLPLTLVRELSILKGVHNVNLEQLAERCVRLEHFQLGTNKIDDILPFVRRTSNLKRIKAFTDAKHHVNIDLVSLNEERKKLLAARKLIIFVPDHIFLAAKWSTKWFRDLNFVELRREDSGEFSN